MACLVEESLSSRVCRRDAVAVGEGEWWGRCGFGDSDVAGLARDFRGKGVGKSD